MTELAPRLADLLTDLGHTNWAVRRRVVAALGELGDAATDALVTSLYERSSEARIAATVDALVASRGDVGRVLLPLTTHPDPAIVADVAQVFGRRKERAAVPALAALLAHADDNVAVAAIEALGRIGGRAAIEALLAVIAAGNFFRTFPAIDVVARSGDPRAVDAIAALLHDPMVAFEATRALGRTGHRAAVAPLTALLAKDGLARVACMALVELRARAATLGSTSSVDDAIRAAAPGLVRRATAALTNADVSERVGLAALLAAHGDASAVPTLMRLLDETPPVALAAAAALRALPRGGDETLVEALGPGARRKAILPLLQDRTSAPSVARCLDDDDGEVRALACQALARFGAVAQAAAIYPLLHDSDPRAAHAALAALQALGGADTERLAIAGALGDDVVVKRASLRLLAYFAPPAGLPAVLACLDDRDARVREAALSALALYEQPAALQALQRASESADARTRANAMRALGHAGAGLDWVKVRLNDDDAWVRYYACQALGRARAEVPALIARLQDPAGQVRVAAIEALAASKAPAAIAALRDASSSSDADLRRAALIGLGFVGDDGARAILVQALGDADAATRLVALGALAPLAGDDVTAAIAQAARGADVGAAAVQSLAQRAGPASTRALVALLGTQLRPQVIAALHELVPGRVEGLRSALREAPAASADDDVAPVIAGVLARLDGDAGLPALLEALDLGVPAAATSLAALGTAQAQRALEQAADHHPDPELRRACALLARR